MFEYQPYMWLALSIILFVIEASTSNLITIWFAIAAFIAMIVSVFIPNIVLTSIVFVISAAVLLLCTRKFVRKFVKKTKTNVGTLTGRKALVTKTIDNSKGEGLISVNGIVWSAYSQNDSIIEVGSQVIILSISGVKAVVEKIQ